MSIKLKLYGQAPSPLDSPMPILAPFHNYLGLGDRGGTPIDSDDSLARLHDNEYSKGQEPSADNLFIQDALEDFKTNQNFHSLGAAGVIYGKQVLSRMGIIGKRPADQPMEGTSSKMSAMQPDSSVSPQSGSSVAGGTGASTSGTPIITAGQYIKKPDFVFKKCFQIYTAGLQFKKATANPFYSDVDWAASADQPLISSANILATPLASINPNQLPIYLTQAEYDQLPNFAYATTCRIKVTPLGYRLPFATNETDSTFANSQTLIQIGYGIGINNQMNCAEAAYALDTTDLTLIDSATINIATNGNPLTDTLYGYSPAGFTIGANVGVPRYWNRYLQLIYQNNGTNEPSTPNLLDMISVVNINDCKGAPCCDYEYSFKNGLIKLTNANNLNQQFEIGNCRVPNGCESTMFGTRRFSNYGTATQRYSQQDYSSNQYLTAATTDPRMDYYSMIDKADSLVRQQNQRTSPDHAPLVTFGCMPVQSNAAMAPTATFAHAAVQWCIETELHVTATMDSVLATAFRPNLAAWDPLWAQAEFRGNISRKWSVDYGGFILLNRRIVNEASPYNIPPIWPDPPILLSNTTIEEEQPEHVIEGTPTIRKIKK